MNKNAEKKKKLKSLLAWLLPALFIMIAGAWYALAGGAELALDSSLALREDVSYRSDIRVEAAGAVAYPGIYTLSNDARVEDLIHLAGGFTPEADASELNLADALFDRERVYVPTAGEEVESLIGYWNLASEPAETTEATEPAKPDGDETSLINLNTASREELMTLPGLGETLAENIVNYREEHGRFTTVDEIVNVDRIGEGLLERWRDRLTVD